ncbi:MAG: NAD-dependent epimerase/dehydratase family protein [Zoogloeaceae bacterium]|jgi:GDP-L-fucose synthase|nr:NAD-dependent epimerase/dehydratase family protein [Zoogloeaceae bacterium]
MPPASRSTLVTGSAGALGTAILQELADAGYTNILHPAKSEMDCLDPTSVDRWFEEHRPEYVFHLAAVVYGLQGNLDNQIRGLRENVRVADTVLSACARFSVKKVFYAGTVAAYGYPYVSLPLREEDAWKGEPHGGEYGYASAKRYAYALLRVLRQSAGLDFSYGLFTNLYGENDRFNTRSGHVIPSLLAKAECAAQTDKKLHVWGRPDVTRDFLYTRDAARAAILCMEHNLPLVNISSGQETSMNELVTIINQHYNNALNVVWQKNQPVGIPRRSVDNSLLRSHGFSPQTTLKNGIQNTIQWLKNHKTNIREN